MVLAANPVAFKAKFPVLLLTQLATGMYVAELQGVLAEYTVPPNPLEPAEQDRLLMLIVAFPPVAFVVNLNQTVFTI